MNSSSKDAVSRKGKSLAPVSSAKNISRDVENFKENVMIIPKQYKMQSFVFFFNVYLKYLLDC
jgi:hypothetical protein